MNIEIENLVFPYGQEKVEAAIQKQMNVRIRKNLEDRSVGQLKIMVNIIFLNVS